MKNKLITLILICLFSLSCLFVVNAADSEVTVNVNVSDPPQVGSTNITVLIKKNFEPGHPSTQPLSGAVFKVVHYGNDRGNATGDPLHTWYFETEDLNPSAIPEAEGKYGINGLSPKLASGYTSSPLIPYEGKDHVWPLGTYVITEVDAPESYQMDKNPRTFIVKYNPDGGKFDAKVETRDGTEWGTSDAFTVKEPENDRVAIDINKGDLENVELSPQGNANLSGIRFAVVLRDSPKGYEYVHYDRPNEKFNNGEVVEILTTDENGYAITAKNTLDNNDYNLRFGKYELIELRRDSTISVGDNYNESTDKYGTSIYANSSYLFSALRQTKNCDINETVIHYGDTNFASTATTGFVNRVVRGGVHVYKADEEEKEAARSPYVPQGDASLAGIRFAIVNKSAEKVKVDGTNRAPGQVVKIITTDEAGEAKTSNEALPFGLYGIYELRDDATIQPGDVYEGSNKLGSSIYANGKGISGIAEREHGSMLWSDMHENFTITYEHEMVGDGTRRIDHQSQTADEKFITDDQRVHYQNPVVRGGFEAYKVDKETMISYALGGADLSGIEFTLKNASKHEVKVNGTFYAPGATIPDAKGTKNSKGAYVWITDKKGWIGSTDEYLPYGTYTLQETHTNDSYHLTDGEPHEFHIRIHKQIVCKDPDSILKTKEEAQSLINTWTGTADRPQANLVFPDQVKRGPLSFHKKDENADHFSNIPWKVTNTTTGEVHYIMTDANGEFNSDKVPHSLNTNAYDDVLKNYEVDGDPIPASVLQDLATRFGDGTAQYNVGFWFSLSQDLSTHAPVNDELGAYPYGWYTLEEMRCDANVGKELVVDEFYIYSDDGAPLGTLDNEPVDLKTHAKDTLTRSDIGKISARDNINDQVDYYGLQTDKHYRLQLELHYAKGEEGHKVDGGIIRDKNNKEVKESINLDPKTRDGYTDLDLGLDSRKLYAGGELLKGPDTVIFAYLYEITESGTEKLVKAAINANDKNETIHYPWIGTTLVDKETDIRMGFARKDMEIIDKVEYHNLVPEEYYTFEGYIVDKDTGEAALDADGNEITTQKKVYIKDKDGFVNLTYKFNGTGMEGKTLVAFETMDSNFITIVHQDIDDEAQNFHIPKISTVAKDKETLDDVGKVVGTFVDTVSYENLIPGYTYTMYCDAMFVDTGKSSGQTGSKQFTAQALPDNPNRSDGTVIIEIPLTLTKAELEGRDLVAFEELKIKPNQDDHVVTEEWLKNRPEEEELLAEHKDINDPVQTVNYPKIRTIAVDMFTEDHVGTVKNPNQVLDTVEYWNLVPGREYTIKGTLYDVNGTKLGTAEPMIFTPTAEDASHGTKVIRFDVDASKLDGHTVVVYEKLFHNDIEVTQHEENNDETQRVHYPWMQTIATDANTGDHVGTIFGRLVNSFRRLVGQDVEDTVYQKVIDRVDYKNTIESEEYTFVGTLMNKETGEPILGDDGNPITSSAVLKAGHPVDGSINIEFSVDSSKLENVTIVCYEKMFHKNPNTNEDVEINRHEDLNDENQSVHDPKIRTHAVDEHVALDEAHKDWHTGDAMGTTTIHDDVTLENLVNGMEYTLKGTLYYKDSGKPVLDKDGKPYENVLNFKVEEDTDAKRVDLVKRISFEVDGKALEGKTVVAFEELYHNDVLVALHADLSDEDQSVYYPWIRTHATNNKNGAKEIQVTENTEVVDRVEFKNLLPGKYKLNGILMDKETGEDLIDSKGEKITQELEFTISSVEEGREGYKDLVFTFDSTTLASHIVVAYETLTLEDENNPEYNVPIAEHKDINDEEQSIWIIDIATHLTDMMTNSDEGEAREEAVWNDHVSYLGLKPGKKYTLKGTLMDKETGEPFVDHNGNQVISTIEFVPETKDGFVDLEFRADTRDLAGHSVVAFEELYPEELPDTIIAEHKDINDKDQTVNIIEIRTNATDAVNATHLNVADPETVIIDRVTYTNLTVGREYILKAVLMDKATGEPVLVNEQQVTQEVRFTPEEPNGFIDVNIPIDTSTLEGVTVVCYEQLFNAEFPEVVVAHHEDLNDEDQSIHIPKIRTTLGRINPDRTVVDKVVYENLIPGIEYTVKGYFVEKATANRVEGSDGVVVFTPTEPNGEIDVTLNANSIETLVAFEELYIEGTAPAPVPENPDTEEPVEQPSNEVLVAKHADLEDEAQTALQFNVKVFKADKKDPKHYLKGAEITVFDQDGNIMKNVDGTDCVGITDENGEAIIQVPYTKDTSYYVQETKAPKGYEINDNKFDANPDSLENDPIECTITILDGAIIIPPTGDFTNVIIYIIALVLMLAAGSGIVLYRKRKLQN